MTEFYGREEEILRRGEKYETLLRGAVTLGLFPEAVGNEETWLEQALAYHREPEGSRDLPILNSRWLRISETKTASGATVGFLSDITEEKQR
ncbi:hypothetical protein [Breoghania sp.]|uniref:hypothetical protein n=1 Tax=Breoghania sp. TaxID=2065378 RepID=UPI00260CDEDE|nr:hypothetical protein [Breoghania sp.]MDJ0932039.1 hypothetical protein [Breoghania sp.]